MLTQPPSAPVEAMSEEARASSLERTMAARPEGEPVRVFAYGSLLWGPCFEFTSKNPARLPGWVRRTCLWTVHARGSLECPGLFYGLDSEPGRACDGAVYELSARSLDDGLERLWQREMHAGVYEPRWLDLETNGKITPALTFVVNRDHPQYTGPIDLETAARLISVARGKFGTCAEYYTATRASLGAEGFADPEIEALVALIDPPASNLS
jgi:cation transport protein ChaC